MSEYFFDGIWRMDWGMGNPNKTAALIATMMAGVWVLAFVWRKGFWLALPLWMGLGVCLVHTFSRGGAVALVCGMVPVVAFAGRPYAKKRVVAVLAAVWVTGGAAWWLAAHERFALGVVGGDRSVGNRLVLWGAAPAMMRAAPGGWGWGESGKMFSMWFQPEDRVEEYRTLVNSHLTWMVEMGWAGRAAYVGGWVLVLMLCWPARGHGWMAAVMGSWVALGVAAWFSSVAEHPAVWAVPGLGLGAVLAVRLMRAWRRGDVRAGWHPWPGWAYVAVPIGVASGVCALLWWMGGESPVRRDGVLTVYGAGEPGVWVLADPEVLGSRYGRTLRRCGAGGATVALLEERGGIGRIPVGAMVVASGTFASREIVGLLAERGVGEMILVSPGCGPEDALGGAGGIGVRAVVGEFSERGFAPSWLGRPETELIAGAGDFLPDWPEAVLGRDRGALGGKGTADRTR